MQSLLAVLLLALPTPAGEPQVHRHIAYAEPKSERLTLDVFAPREGKCHPIVFWIHGGGWQAGDKTDVQVKPQACVDKGFVFVSTNYRLLPDASIKQMAGDVARAIRWVHDHAREYGGDPDTFFVMGHSAGAQLAALVCTDDHYLKAEGMSLSIVKGCVPVDGDTYDVLLQIATVEQKRKDAYRRKFGDEASQKDLSPVTHVARDKGIPPVLILHVAGHPETTAQSQRLVQALREAGVPAKAYPAQGKNHGTINADLGKPGDEPTRELFEFVMGVLSKLQMQPTSETTAGWSKYPGNPVLGGDLGTCFDISVLKEEATYRMWFSWRPRKSIALVESKNGIEWSDPSIVLGPNGQSGWEDDLNRPVVVKNGPSYQMWYTGQARGRSWIGYATSKDGRAWRRESASPVLSADQPWEKVAVMCPHVIYEDGLYRMWYSGGEQGEPNAIGYATSKDGLNWGKHKDNPVFKPGPDVAWEQDRVTACQVIHRDGGYLMFYIGFRDVEHAQIGIARSRDGITGWQRHPANPIIRPGREKWDHDAVYKPYAIFDGRKWLLWYNGRRGGVEQIGLAIHDGEDLGF